MIKKSKEIRWIVTIVVAIVVGAITLTGCPPFVPSDDDDNTAQSDDQETDIEDSGPDLADAGSYYEQLLPNPVSPGENFQALCMVKNAGDQSSGSFNIALYLSTDSIFNAADYLIATESYSSIDAGDFEVCIVIEPDDLIVFPEVPAGDYYVLFVIDSANSVNESNEDNNIGMCTKDMLRVNSISAYESLSVTSPTSSTVLTQGNQNVNISWVTGSLGGTVDIVLYKGSTPVATISSSTTNDGSYTSYDIPTDITPGLDYRVRVYYSSTYNDYSDYFTIQEELDIEVTSPTSSTVWTQGEQNVNINWNTGDLGGTVDISLYKGTSYVSTITSSTTNDGSYTFWDVPSDLSSGTNYRVCVYVDASHYGYSSNFEILSQGGLFPNTVTRTLALYPSSTSLSLVISPSGDYVYVTVCNDDSVKVLRVSDWSIIDEITVDNGPSSVAISHDGVYVYVAHLSDRTLSVIRTSTNTVSKKITLMESPSNVSVDPYGDYLYIANGWAINNSISLIKLSDQTLMSGSLSLENNSAYDIIVSNDGKKFYAITNHALYSEHIFTGAWALASSRTFDSPYPIDLAISPDDSKVFLSMTNNTVQVVSPTDLSMSDSISVGIDPEGIAFTPDGQYAYIANSGSSNVSVIRVSDMVVVETISVGNDPREIAVDPFGHFVVVANLVDGSVTVIE